ncbi:ABC transporter permease [Marinitenerispora sediminis]|uniref:Xylose transport system permease protein XylH n=1 Tax=Marinitenerispora sediminis TaxID=1931232 RepID=A0A368T1E9_9ACTN|nr:ABC transporter permease [Marinitenerispora sediminis]RCV50942.1 ribose ABC transporter permease [Marinitenerispora sediminis]RCV51608.1 ribose ABC transporter permease [Marinitenerispora sediminis]RCV54275.1 ribose ABC transporter permease [Marinitenerispora sediminis]
MAGTTTSPAPAPAAGVPRAPLRVRVLRRPEVGALVAALAVFLFFSLATDAFLTPRGVASWLESAALFGIMAVAVSMLMIGGEFDLSTGVMVGSTGLLTGVLATHAGVNLWIAVLASLAAALAVGFLNGLMVTRTGLPSFIVTLGTFFILQGLNLALTKAVTGQVAVQGMTQVAGFWDARWLFGSSMAVGPAVLDVPILWWVLFTALCTWVLLRTRAGNWIFAVGGDAKSARQTGVPVVRTKIGLFMTTAFAGWLVGMLSLFGTTTVQASTGVGVEFVYIICAVVGGCLLTGGVGSALGGALGALIYGMAYQGIVFAGWDNNWLKAFLGAMLLAAVVVNTYVRRRAETAGAASTEHTDPADGGGPAEGGERG